MWLSSRTKNPHLRLQSSLNGIVGTVWQPPYIGVRFPYYPLLKNWELHDNSHTKCKGVEIGENYEKIQRRKGL